LTKVKDLKI